MIKNKFFMVALLMATMFSANVKADEYSDCVQNNCSSCGTNCYYAYVDSDNDGVSDTLNFYGPTAEADGSGTVRNRLFGAQIQGGSSIKTINFNGNFSSIGDRVFNYTYLPNLENVNFNGNIDSIDGQLINFSNVSDLVVTLPSSGDIVRGAFGEGTADHITLIVPESREIISVDPCGESNCDIIVGENTRIAGPAEVDSEYSEGLLVYCTGNLEKCIQNIVYPEEDEEAGTIDASRIVQATLLTENGVTTVKDGDGNTLASYKAKSNNTPESTKEVKRIYTVEEASRLVSSKGNTFKIRYR